MHTNCFAIFFYTAFFLTVHTRRVKRVPGVNKSYVLQLDGTVQREESREPNCVRPEQGMNKKTKGLYCTNYREPVKKWSHVPFQVDEGIRGSNRGEPDFQGGRAAIQSSRYSSVLESSKYCIACAYACTCGRVRVRVRHWYTYTRASRCLRRTGTCPGAAQVSRSNDNANGRLSVAAGKTWTGAEAGNRCALCLTAMQPCLSLLPLCVLHDRFSNFCPSTHLPILYPFCVRCARARLEEVRRINKSRVQRIEDKMGTKP